MRGLQSGHDAVSVPRESHHARQHVRHPPAGWPTRDPGRHVSDPPPLVTAIIEDHALFRDAISVVVESMPDLELGPVLADGDEALEAFERGAPDLVLVDYSLNSGDAPGLIATIRARWPHTRFLVLSGHLSPDHARASLDAGACGYVLKGRPADFEKAIRAVLSGHTYVSDAVYDE